MTSHLLRESLHSHHAENDLQFLKRWMQTAPLLHCVRVMWGRSCVVCVCVCVCAFQRDMQPSNWFRCFHPHQLAITGTILPKNDVFWAGYDSYVLVRKSSTASVSECMYVWVNCSSMQFHAHLWGDEHLAFNSHKDRAAPMPFPVLVISSSGLMCVLFLLTVIGWKMHRMEVSPVLVFFCPGHEVMRIHGCSPGPQCLLIKWSYDKPFAA